MKLSILTAVLALTLGAAPAQANELTRGEVRRIDNDGRKIHLRHEHIANLDMPPMSMVFDVADPAMLAGIKAGDKVAFTAEQRDGRFMVTRIGPVATP